MTTDTTYTDRSARPPATITGAEYIRARRHQHAGPVAELVTSTTRELYGRIGATHWQIVCEDGATVLRPVCIGGA